MSQTNPKRMIVMTGATSGIGAQAVKQLAALPDTLILTGALVYVFLRANASTEWSIGR
jgi:NAD(P)-dependent dehydrogenase (short-subunit alcohol dehydrogenase family)